MHSYRNNRNWVFWSKNSKVTGLDAPYGLKTMKLKCKYALRSLSWDTALKKTDELYTTELLCSHDPSRSIENQTSVTQSLSKTFKFLFQLCPCILISCSSSNVYCKHSKSMHRGWRQPVTGGTFPHSIYSAQPISFPKHFFKIPLIKQSCTLTLIYLFYVELQWHLP